MKTYRKYQGLSILIVLSLAPILLWLQYFGLAGVTESPGAFIAATGKATALSGVILYMLMPILSTRHIYVERLFGGSARTHRLHTRGGQMAFYLILLHPLLLGAGRLINNGTISTIWDWTSILVVSGLLAFAIFVAVGIVSIYSHIHHQTWIWAHHFFGWLIPLFLLHGLLAGSQVVQNSWLLGYVLFWTVFGFTAFLYRTVFDERLIKRYRYEVGEVNNFTDDVIEVVLKPLGTRMEFTPGQFAYISFESDAVDAEAHPFSFSNANDSPYLRFTIKSLGDDTTNMRNLKQGVKAFVEGPYGQFSFKSLSRKRQVWIAGGIGITPFLSMARSFSGAEQYDIHFFYGTDTLESAVFLQEFMDITRHLPANFRTTVVSKDISGFVTVSLLKKSLGDLRDFDYMVCGPPTMMRSLREQLILEGVPDDHIAMEVFKL